MSSRKKKRVDLRAVRAQADPDDGTDPRFWHDRRTRGTDRKLRQLCKQVGDAVQLALGGTHAAEAFVGAIVAQVTPAPNAGNLAVEIEVASAQQQAEAQAALARVGGYLRGEVAQAITRRRAPQLTFVVLVRRQSDAQ